MEFLLALQFLTMIPVTVRGKVESYNLARAMAWFPLVGLIIGLLSVVLYSLSALVFPDSVCNLLVIGFLVVITGNMHGDGLMDTVDGIFSGRPKERILEIMKDSRVGSHGVAAGVLLLLAKFVLLGQISGELKMAALITVPVLGRWAQVYGAAVFPYARIEGGTGSFTDQVGRRELLWASLTLLIVCFGMFVFRPAMLTGALAGYGITDSLLKGTVLIGGTVAGIIWSARYISRKLGGLTGDTYGAMNEFAEVTALLMLVLLSR